MGHAGFRVRKGQGDSQNKGSIDTAESRAMPPRLFGGTPSPTTLSNRKLRLCLSLDIYVCIYIYISTYRESPYISSMYGDRPYQGPMKPKQASRIPLSRAPPNARRWPERGICHHQAQQRAAGSLKAVHASCCPGLLTTQPPFNKVNNRL